MESHTPIPPVDIRFKKKDMWPLLCLKHLTFSMIIKKQTYIGNLSLWSSSYVFEVENFMFGIEEATEVNYDLILTNILIFPRLR